jgi:L-ascorbate metabolism protein UlaG (beta-lactamase superfamily)
VVLVTDPFPPSLGLSIGEVEASAISMSHDHPNHSSISGIRGTPRVLQGPGEYEVRDVYVRGFLTPPAEDDPPEKRNTAFIIEMDGLKLCHLGDISHPLSGSVAADLAPLDILLAPAGGGCTLAISQVSELAQSLESRIVVPMHYKLPELSVETGPLEPFLREMGAREIEPQARLVVTPSTLPGETRVVVLQAQGTPATAEEAS